ncbi:MAG TPA: GGDEF domain-containing protein [Desulfovibrio sp.]|nr:GGDEF domain-containing protein [Desulfovibrio sp.]
MRFQDADRLRYKISLPLILILALAALYLFHTLLIEKRGYADLNRQLSNVKTSASALRSGEPKNGFNVEHLKYMIEELGNYPEKARFYSYLNHEETAFFDHANKFVAALKSGESAKLEGSFHKLDGALGIISSDIHKMQKAATAKMTKIEYGLLFLICLLAVMHYSLVDYPMREELKRCALEKEVSKSTIKKLAERDTLTNLPGRMKFYEESEKAVSTATRYGSNLALIKLDIHDFKGINRKHGQKAGDKILAGFARVVRKNLRRPDSFFRVGGDKFIILAPHTSLTNAKNLSEKINKLITQTKSLKVVPFMLNTGIAMCEKGDSGESLLKKVDLALNESKKYGPGAVYTHPEPAKLAE